MSFKGVYRHRERWQVKIRLDGRMFSAGMFDDQTEAAHNYDYHASQNGLPDLNFPDFDYQGFIPKKSSLKSNRHNKVGFSEAQRLRELFRRSDYTVNALAEKFSLSDVAVYNILNQKSYPEPPDTSIVKVIHNV